MITGVAFVPSTPLLVPALATGAAAELDDLRDASILALRAALATPAQRLVVLGAGAATRTHVSGTGTFRGFGVDLDVPLDPAVPGGPLLPLSLTVGAWLVARAGWPGERLGQELDPDAADHELDSVGAALAGGEVPTALLVVADGSAARSEKAPAALHPDAAAFDAAASRALCTGDAGALAALDADLARAVSAAGRPAWRTAAAAAHGLPVRAELLADVAPYGVGYLVAAWRTGTPAA